MRKSIEVIFNLILWIIITYITYNFAKTYSHIAVNSYGMFHIPYLVYSTFITTIPHIVNFYFFYFLLVPKFLVRKKIALFFTFALISCVIFGYAIRLTYGGTGSALGNLVFFTLVALFNGILGSAVKGIFLWIDSLVEKNNLEKKNLMSKNALLMLQAQINPHFLFNSLNNIDILIEESPKSASEYLKKLSDILRYVLYETKEDETELVKEINQIQSYIDLQKIRTNNPNYVNFKITGELKDQKIAPMIFIPFIENAFKHSKNKAIENAIDIEFEINDKLVRCQVITYKFIL